MVQTPAPALVNGGFPEPPLSDPVKIVSAVHTTCGKVTGVRLPVCVPTRAVQRMHCPSCAVDFDTLAVEELGIMDPQARQAVAAAVGTPAAAPAPAVKAPRSFSIPRIERRRGGDRRQGATFNAQGRVWKLVSIPLAAFAVVAGLALLQGDGESPDGESPAAQATLQSNAAAEVAPEPGAAADPAVAAAGTEGSDGSTKGGESKASKNTKLVRGSTYSLALPAGWERVAPVGGATFAAVSPGSEADVQLWIDEDPKLDFPTFISQSLTQIEALTGSARIVERIPASTPEATIVRLAADAPADQPSYEVTLRVAGPYRYYLAGSVHPDAAPEAAEGVELIVGSFTPELGN